VIAGDPSMQLITVESYVHVLIFLLVCLKNLNLLEIISYITNKGLKGYQLVKNMPVIQKPSNS